MIIISAARDIITIITIAISNSWTFYEKKLTSRKSVDIDDVVENAACEIEFFRIEFYGIYRICRWLFLVIFIFKITKSSILQNP